MFIYFYATADTGMAGAGAQPGRIGQRQNPNDVFRILPVYKKSVDFGKNHFLDSDFQIFVFFTGVHGGGQNGAGGCFCVEFDRI